jgi:tRNA(Ile2)-agmatinylcytidine synthase
MRCLVGIDDTDSSRGFCTTYLAYRISADRDPSYDVLPYPRLVRLNPNVPFKTRGNAAVSLVIETRDPPRAFDAISARVEELSDVKGGANAGMVFLEEAAGRSFHPVYLEALSGILSPHTVKRFVKRQGGMFLGLGNGMGVVGAAASLGFDESEDHTFELIAYRRRESWGKPREIDPASVKAMEATTFPHTFNSFDHQKRKTLVAPHGPDPVLMGIRGDSPEAVAEAFSMVRCQEAPEGWMVYLTNQHTDAHLRERLDWKTFSSGWDEGTVLEVSTGRGGHVYLTMKGRQPFRCAAYEPTGDLRRASKLLTPGDRIRVYGGVRKPTSLHPKILNLERFDVLSLRRPGSKLRKGAYIASPRANRHLTKPLSRYGLELGCTDREALKGVTRPRGPLGSLPAGPQYPRFLQRL